MEGVPMLPVNHTAPLITCFEAGSPYVWQEVLAVLPFLWVSVIAVVALPLYTGRKKDQNYIKGSRFHT